jgi:hypothetical protein
MGAEVTYTNNENRESRYPLNLVEKTCSCRQWQLHGKPCIHAFFFMSVLGEEEGEVDQYVCEYFSITKFRAAYDTNVPTLLGKE